MFPVTDRKLLDGCYADAESKVIKLSYPPTSLLSFYKSHALIDERVHDVREAKQSKAKVLLKLPPPNRLEIEASNLKRSQLIFV